MSKQLLYIFSSFLFIIWPLLLLYINVTQTSMNLVFPLIILNFYLVLGIVAIAVSYKDWKNAKTNLATIRLATSILGMGTVLATNIYPLFRIPNIDSFLTTNIFLVGLAFIVANFILASISISRKNGHTKTARLEYFSFLVAAVCVLSTIPFLFFQSIVFYYNPYFRTAVPITRINCSNSKIIVKSEWNSGGYSNLFTQAQYDNVTDSLGFGSIYQDSISPQNYSNPQFNDKATQELKDCVNKEVGSR